MRNPETNNVIVDKSEAFAVEIVKLYQYLCSQKKEFVLSKQLLRAGTSVGANVSEAERGQSHADFISKNSIALKEANESAYWIRLLHKTGYIDYRTFQKYHSDCEELIRILVSITKHRDK